MSNIHGFNQSLVVLPARDSRTKSIFSGSTPDIWRKLTNQDVDATWNTKEFISFLLLDKYECQTYVRFLLVFMFSEEDFLDTCDAILDILAVENMILVT